MINRTRLSLILVIKIYILIHIHACTHKLIFITQRVLTIKQNISMSYGVVLF